MLTGSGDASNCECPSGEIWDTIGVSDQCGCPPGESWDGVSDSCDGTIACPESGEFWDSTNDTCACPSV